MVPDIPSINSNSQISVKKDTSTSKKNEEEKVNFVKHSVFSDLFKGKSIDKPIAERDIQLPLPDSKEYKMYMSVLKSFEKLESEGLINTDKLKI